jgi:hypothetical protein
MITMPPNPWYFDWTFWAAALSLLAIVLSQLPPLHLLLRPKRLEVEVHSRIQLTHMAGNPNASVVVSIRNTGGRQLRVKSVTLGVSRDAHAQIVLPGQGYFETPSAVSSVLFVPFTLKPGETWAHSITFVNTFERQIEKLFREKLSTLDGDLRRKLRDRPEENREAVVADPANVAPFIDLYRRLFAWYPGEYIAELTVSAEPGSASFKKRYRFTLFESDTEDLRAYQDDYKFGVGLTFKADHHSGVNIPIIEHDA